MDKKQKSFIIPLLGLIIAILAFAVSLFAGIGTRFEWWNFRMGLTVLSWSAYAGIAGGIVSLLGIIILLFLKNKRGFTAGIVGLIISILVAGMPWKMMQIAKKVPPIHDITTDTVNPPQFVAALPLRKNAVNPTDYDAEKTAPLQEKAYPDIKTLMLSISADQAFDKAMGIVEKMKWKTTAADRGEGRIEAYDTTFWMGFKDDIVIRIVPNGSGSRLDIRSESRVGKGDFGANAKRVRKFLSAMQG